MSSPSRCNELRGLSSSALSHRRAQLFETGKKEIFESRSAASNARILLIVEMTIGEDERQIGDEIDQPLIPSLMDLRFDGTQVHGLLDHLQYTRSKFLLLWT